MCPIKDWRENSSDRSDRIEEFSRISNEMHRQMDDERARKQNKNSSVIGRGVAGAIVAGPVGAVVGALSAVDKNMRNKK